MPAVRGPCLPAGASRPSRSHVSSPLENTFFSGCTHAGRLRPMPSGRRVAPLADPRDLTPRKYIFSRAGHTAGRLRPMASGRRVAPLAEPRDLTPRKYIFHGLDTCRPFAAHAFRQARRARRGATRPHPSKIYFFAGWTHASRLWPMSSGRCVAPLAEPRDTRVRHC